MGVFCIEASVYATIAPVEQWGCEEASMGLALVARHLALEQPWVLAILGGNVTVAPPGRQSILRRFGAPKLVISGLVATPQL